MNESFLLKSAMIFSVIGLIVLGVVAYHADRTSIKKLFLEEEKYRVEGSVRSVKSTGKATFISLETVVMEEVLVFSNLSIGVGEKVLVEGRRDGGIIAERIERLS